MRMHILTLTLPLVLCALAGCDQGPPQGLDPAIAVARRVVGGDAETGRRILAEGIYGCGTCHAIPGVRGARGSVGPPLHGMALRGYVAGRLPNYPDNLIRWIHDPQAIDPQSAMPDTGISPEEAAHVAAYLYTLEELP